SDGVAAFRADALNPGEHRIRAEFVPAWSDDLTAARSDPVTIAVRGAQKPRPDADDVEPASDAAISALPAATAATVTSADRTVAPGGSLAVAVGGPPRGDWVSVWRHVPAPIWLGWIEADLRGACSVDLPDSVAAGAYRLVLKDAAGAL